MRAIGPFCRCVAIVILLRKRQLMQANACAGILIPRATPAATKSTPNGTSGPVSHSFECPSIPGDTRAG